MAHEALAPLALSRWLIDYVEQHAHINRCDLVTALGYPQNTPVGALDRLSLPKYLRLLNLAADRLNDLHFGLNLARQTPVNAFGSVGLLMHHCATLRDNFGSLNRFGSLLSNAMEFIFIDGPVSSQLQYRILVPSDEDCRQDNEYTLALFVLYIRHYVSDRWHPTRVNFSHPKPEDIGAHLDLFQCAVHFEQAVTSFSFDSSILNTRISEANPQLLSLLREHVEQNLNDLKRHDKLITKVRYYISTTLSTKECTIAYAGRSLLMSTRSLTRHLEQLGTSFRSIKQDVMVEMAKSALSETASPIIEIAIQLGFSETSAFDRSFKNLTGCTPQQYRRLSHDTSAF